MCLEGVEIYRLLAMMRSDRSQNSKKASPLSLRLPYDHAPKREYVCAAAFPYFCINVSHQHSHFPFGYCVHRYLLLLVEVFSERWIGCAMWAARSVRSCKRSVRAVTAFVRTKGHRVSTSLEQLYQTVNTTTNNQV